MKQMTCAQMGGPATCDFVVTGNTAEEMTANGTTHVMESHPDIVAQMEAMSPEDKANWMTDFQAKFDIAADVQ